MQPADCVSVPTGTVQPCSDSHLAFLSRFMKRDSSFLEIGATDCAVSLSAAARVKHVYAAARSTVIAAPRRQPANFHLILAEGASVPVPPGTVSLAYSNGLIDTLNLQETMEQLANVYHALARGGVYVCFARNRLLDMAHASLAGSDGPAGPPHTLSELCAVLRKVGFRKIVQHARCASVNVPLFGLLARVLDLAICRLPGARERACSSNVLRALLDIRLVARK